MKNTIITSIITTLTILAALQWPLIVLATLWVLAALFNIFYTIYIEEDSETDFIIILALISIIMGPTAWYLMFKEYDLPTDFKWLPKFQSPIVFSKKHE